MAIHLFGSYCVVVLKSEKTAAWEEGVRAHVTSVNRRIMERAPDHSGMPPFEDEALIAYPAGQGPSDADLAASELEALGCAHMRDFAMSVGGEFEKVPTWLRVLDWGGVEFVQSTP
ncbi:hypothetical protein [Rhizobacter fulvus]